MPTIYFDTTVYDDIAKGDVVAEDVERVRRLAARGAIRAYPSLMNVEELLGQWIKILRDLIGFDNILKQPRDLLDDAIHAYAERRTTPPVTLTPDHRDIVVRYLEGLLHGVGAANVSDIVANVRVLKDGSRQAMAANRNRVFTGLKCEDVARSQPGVRRWDTVPVWHGLTTSVAEIFVTGDRRLAQLLRRVLVANFEVVESPRQLLDHLRIAQRR